MAVNLEVLSDFQREEAVRLLGLPVGSRARIKVRVRSRTQGVVVHGAYIESGEKLYDVYEEHLPAYESLVERDMGTLAAARHQYQLDMDDRAKLARGEDVVFIKPYEPSVEASFRALARRDVLPFDSVEVMPAQAATKR